MNNNNSDCDRILQVTDSGHGHSYGHGVFISATGPSEGSPGALSLGTCEEEGLE